MASGDASWIRYLVYVLAVIFSLGVRETRTLEQLPRERVSGSQDTLVSGQMASVGGQMASEEGQVASVGGQVASVEGQLASVLAADNEEASLENLRMKRQSTKVRTASGDNLVIPETLPRDERGQRGHRRKGQRNRNQSDTSNHRTAKTRYEPKTDWYWVPPDNNYDNGYQATGYQYDRHGGQVQVGRQGMMSDSNVFELEREAERRTEKLHADLLRLYEKVLDELVERDKLKDKLDTLQKSVTEVGQLQEKVKDLEATVTKLQNLMGMGDKTEASDNSLSPHMSANQRFADATMHSMLLKQFRQLQKKVDDQGLLIQEYRHQSQAQRAMIVSHAELIEQCGSKLNILNTETDIQKARTGKLATELHWLDFRVQTADNLTRSTRLEVKQVESAVSGLYADHGHFYDTTSTLQKELKEHKLDLLKLQSRTNLQEGALQKVMSRNLPLNASQPLAPPADQELPPGASWRSLDLAARRLVYNFSQQQSQLDELSLDVERIKDNVMDTDRAVRAFQGRGTPDGGHSGAGGSANTTVPWADYSRGLDRLRQRVAELETSLLGVREDQEECGCDGRSLTSSLTSAERSRGKAKTRRPDSASSELTADNMLKAKKQKHKNGRHGHSSEDDDKGRKTTSQPPENDVIKTTDGQIVFDAGYSPDSKEDDYFDYPDLRENYTKDARRLLEYGSVENKVTSHELQSGALRIDPSEQDICSMVGIKLGQPRTVALFPHVLSGTWMRDSQSRDNHIYVLKDDFKVNHVREYYREDAIIRGNASAVHKLPFPCTGTGHVMYNGSLYCHRYGSNRIVKYHMTRKDMVTRRLYGAGFNNTYPYFRGGYTDIDFAVDEVGLWVIYATRGSAGNITLASLDPETLDTLQEWRTFFPKRRAFNAFMICGRLHVVQSIDARHLAVTYMYDTRHRRGRRVAKNRLVLKSNAPSVSMLDYNPKDSKLYGWDVSVNWEGRLVNFDVYFTSDPL